MMYYSNLPLDFLSLMLVQCPFLCLFLFLFLFIFLSTFYFLFLLHIHKYYCLKVGETLFNLSEFSSILQSVLKLKNSQFSVSNFKKFAMLPFR
jgi:hypothetical protein